VRRSGPITVAIPTFNGERHLAEALASVLAQEGEDFELLVCDDRSDDATLEIVRNLAGDRARIVLNSERLGLGGNWNRCVTESRSPWVAVFHQDDRMRPGHLASHQRVISTLANTAGETGPIGLIAGPAGVIGDDGTPISGSLIDPGGLPDSAAKSDDVLVDNEPNIRLIAPGQLIELLADQNPLRCSAITTNRAAHHDVAGFDTKLRYVVDWDFWIRVSRRWGLAWLMGPPTVDVRWHTRSETHRFKPGTADLEEIGRLQAELFANDLASHPERTRLRRNGDRRLARAFLNRAHDALQSRQPALARACLQRAVRLWPGIVGSIVSDPRLFLKVATLSVSPAMAIRAFGSSFPENEPRSVPPAPDRSSSSLAPTDPP
jgi:glycosyltransferase involved in cell wall biosynthesis